MEENKILKIYCIHCGYHNTEKWGITHNSDTKTERRKCLKCHKTFTIAEEFWDLNEKQGMTFVDYIIKIHKEKYDKTKKQIEQIEKNLEKKHKDLEAFNRTINNFEKIKSKSSINQK
jgi:transcriptional regulator NrdR family protein